MYLNNRVHSGLRGNRDLGGSDSDGGGSGNGDRGRSSNREDNSVLLRSESVSKFTKIFSPDLAGLPGLAAPATAAAALDNTLNVVLADGPNHLRVAQGQELQKITC